jgi:hypothetical protein
MQSSRGATTWKRGSGCGRHPGGEEGDDLAEESVQEVADAVGASFSSPSSACCLWAEGGDLGSGAP